MTAIIINPYALSPVAPAATREYRALKNTTFNASSVTVTGCDVGAAATDRYVVVSIDITMVSNRNITAVSIGGVAATIAVQASLSYAGGYYLTAIAAAPLPAGTTADVAITLSGSSGASGVRVATYRTVGLQSGVAEDFASSTASSSSKTLNVDVSAGGLLFGRAIAKANSGANWSFSGATEDATFEVGTSTYCVMGSEEISADETGKAITLNGSGGGSYASSYVAASFR